MADLINEKLIVYQVFPRILTNETENCVPYGSLQQNGSGKFNDFTPRLLKSIRQLGCNCIWFTGVIEHATKTHFDSVTADNPYIVKGEAGSPFAIRDYYDVDPSLAVNIDKRMEEFENMVRRTRQAGLKVIIDFVPNHTARQYHSDAAPDGVEDFGVNDDITMFFTPNNNYYYITNQLFAPSIPLGQGDDRYMEFPAKATGNDCFNAFCNEYDWYETAKLNYGHDYGDNSDHFDLLPDTWLKMRDILLFWCAKGVDGFRCDMAFMVPQPFWHWAIAEVKKHYPATLFIAEIYDISLYRPFIDYCGFDYLYDKVNLYDTIVGIERHGYSAARLTGCWQAVDGIADKMLNFIENHDEVRYGSPDFGGDPMKVTPALVTSAMISRGPFMIYYGQELGECATDNEGFAGNNNRTTIFDYWSYSSMRRWIDKGKCSIQKLTPQQKWLRQRYAAVLRLCNSEKAISQGGFFDLMYANLSNPDFNPHHIFAFLRYCADTALLITVNFDDTRQHIAINIPQLAFDMIHLPNGNICVTELLTDASSTIQLSPDSQTNLIVEPHDALILKIKLPNTQKR